MDARTLQTIRLLKDFIYFMLFSLHLKLDFDMIVTAKI